MSDILGKPVWEQIHFLSDEFVDSIWDQISFVTGNEVNNIVEDPVMDIVWNDVRGVVVGQLYEELS